MQAARDQAQEESAQKSREISRLEGEVASHLQTIAECKARIREDEMVRRKLHNTIQELKGTVLSYRNNYALYQVSHDLHSLMYGGCITHTEHLP